MKYYVLDTLESTLPPAGLQKGTLVEQLIPLLTILDTRPIPGFIPVDGDHYATTMREIARDYNAELDVNTSIWDPDVEDLSFGSIHRPALLLPATFSDDVIDASNTGCLLMLFDTVLDEQYDIIQNWLNFVDADGDKYATTLNCMGAAQCADFTPALTGGGRLYTDPTQYSGTTYPTSVYLMNVKWTESESYLLIPAVVKFGALQPMFAEGFYEFPYKVGNAVMVPIAATCPKTTAIAYATKMIEESRLIIGYQTVSPTPATLTGNYLKN